jgi:DNA-directed RNA polymerase subunit beta'
MGLITNNECHNQVIDVWTSANAQLTELAMKEDQQGFNRYMMLDSGSKGIKRTNSGSANRICVVCLQAKKLTAGGGEIENPILSNFEGLFDPE